MKNPRKLARHYEVAVAGTMASLADMLERYLSTDYPSPMTRMSLHDIKRQLHDCSSWLVADETLPLPQPPSTLIATRARALIKTLRETTAKQPARIENPQFRAMRQLCNGSAELLQDLLNFLPSETDNGRRPADHPRAHRSGPRRD